jgi:hypothetical protein
VLLGGGRRVAGTFLAAAACAVACTGCGTGAEKDGVRAAAGGLYRDIRNGDGASACGRLVPQAASALETGDAQCEEEILQLGLKGGPLSRVEVWSDQARVHAGSDTVFLTRWSTGWRVTGAGCEARENGPYDCEISA